MSKLHALLARDEKRDSSNNKQISEFFGGKESSRNGKKLF